MYVQAENDDQDVAAMVGGVVQGLNLTPEQERDAGRNVSYCRLNDYGKDVLGQIDAVVARLGIDLLVLDPLFAYLPGSISDQAQVSEFLRSRLQPFLERHNCGAVVLHHIPKPPSTKKDKPDWRGGDFAYAGFGSAELANFFKAIIVLRNIGSRDVFELIVAKRHKKAGLTDEDGALTDRIHIQHSLDPSLQYWERADKETASQAEAGLFVKYGDALMLAANGVLPCTITKSVFANAAQVSAKTIERLFKDKPFVTVAAAGGTKRLKLTMARGKVTGCEAGPAPPPRGLRPGNDKTTDRDI
jgi:hypothetical protein